MCSCIGTGTEAHISHQGIYITPVRTYVCMHACMYVCMYMSICPVCATGMGTCKRTQESRWVRFVHACLQPFNHCFLRAFFPSFVRDSRLHPFVRTS